MQLNLLLCSILLLIFSVKALTSTLDPPQNSSITLNLVGHIDPSQVLSFIYVPFTVPDNTTSIYVFQNYTGRGEGSSLDIGIFDQNGHSFNTTGFRGWSGGARNNFTISPFNDTTPSYIGGEIKSGEWNIILGPYTSQPQGIDYNLTVVINSTNSAVNSTFTPNFAPQSIPNTTKNYYRGELHVHTIYSDGQRTPAQLVADALSRSLEFFFSTEHNTDSADLMWGEYKDSGLLIGRGEEVTTRHGHWGALGLAEWQWIDWRYNPSDASDFHSAIDYVHNAGGFAIANHPYATCAACVWEFGYDYVDAIEVWNGYWKDTDEMALSLWHSMLVNGSKITAVGGSDAHALTDTVGRPQNVIKADSLSTVDLIKGMKQRNNYLVVDPPMTMNFTVEDQNGNVLADIGDSFEHLLHPFAVMHIQVAGMVGGNISFVDDSKILYSFNTTADGSGEFKYATWLVPSKFVRIEARSLDNNTMLGMTNPIWFNRQGYQAFRDFLAYQ